jgi:hypothetical protein
MRSITGQLVNEIRVDNSGELKFIYKIRRLVKNDMEFMANTRFEMQYRRNAIILIT